MYFWVLGKLAPHLPQEMLQKTLEAALSIQYDLNRAHALSELAPHQPQVLPEALEATLGIQYDLNRAVVFSNLLSVLNLSSIKFHLWCEILHNLSHRARFELLQDIPKLSDAIIALGGTEALAETLRAIQEVCRQWR